MSTNLIVYNIGYIISTYPARYKGHSQGPCRKGSSWRGNDNVINYSTSGGVARQACVPRIISIIIHYVISTKIIKFNQL